MKVTKSELLTSLTFDRETGLIPAIVQDWQSQQVLMLAYMNKDAIVLTLETGLATYYSRSRQELWVKGKTSGHYQHVKKILVDCDQDTLLIMVEQIGVACHTGKQSCFFQILSGGEAID